MRKHLSGSEASDVGAGGREGLVGDGEGSFYAYHLLRTSCAYTGGGDTSMFWLDSVCPCPDIPGEWVRSSEQLQPGEVFAQSNEPRARGQGEPWPKTRLFKDAVSRELAALRGEWGSQIAGGADDAARQAKELADRLGRAVATAALFSEAMPPDRSLPNPPTRACGESAGSHSRLCTAGATP